MGRVRAHTRTVQGRKVKVRNHSRRQLRPGRAGENLKKAWRLRRRGRHGKAAILGGLAAAEITGWLALRGTGVALISAGAIVAWVGVTARRATQDGTVTSGGRRLSPYELGRLHGDTDRRSNWKGPMSDSPKYGDGDPRSAEYERGYSHGAGYGQAQPAAPTGHQPGGQRSTPPQRAPHLSQPGLSRSSQLFREQMRRNATPRERAESDEFYRLRETEGYRGPIQWNKGEMPRKTT